MRPLGFAALALFLSACGGSVSRSEEDVSRAPPGQAGGPPAGTTNGDAGSGGSLPPMTSAEPDAGAAPPGETPFMDPGCPDVQRMPGPNECDPFAPVSECDAGERCVPTVEYPDDCGTERFGTVCAVAGPGIQGDDCEVESCAARHVCVTTGQGSQCVQLCTRSPGGDDCPAGLVCEPLDVDGYYVCF